MAAKRMDASFSRIQEALEGVATSQADIIDRFNVLETRHQQDRQKITSLTTELTALKEKLRTQDGESAEPVHRNGRSLRPAG